MAPTFSTVESSKKLMMKMHNVTSAGCTPVWFQPLAIFSFNALVCFGVLACFTCVVGSAQDVVAQDPLPSWNDSKSKQAIVGFVETVTTEGSDGFVPVEQRIATFDNDGTLWAEQPMYVQAFFVFDRVKALAPQHPEWKTTEPFASVLKGDLKSVLAGGHESLLEIVMASHAGMTTDEFDKIATDWMNTTRHPKTGRLFTEMVYQPMLELLDYLRANDFKTFIVSGGGIDFMRPWTERVYGIPPEQVVGSSVKAKFAVVDGVPVIQRLPEINFIDDKAGKPVGIQNHIGQRPIFAAGNSDGDFEMMQWTTAGEGSRFAMYVHHTDADREWAYDRESSVGRLDRGLDEGPELGWTIVDMKQDWNQIYPAIEANASTSNVLFGKWLAEDIGNHGVLDRAQSTFVVEEDGSVSGSTAVNRYRGKATIQGDEIKFGPLIATRRAAPRALMDQEARFLKALEGVVGYRIDANGLLYLIDAEGVDQIRFSAMSE